MFSRVISRSNRVFFKQLQRSFATISTADGDQLTTNGDLPAVGSTAPDFTGLVATDLSEVGLSDYAGKKKVLNIYLSADTGTCVKSIEEFNTKAAGKSAVVLGISPDLPFALGRVCGENYPNVQTLSSFRSDFMTDYGLVLQTAPLTGFNARAVVVLDESNKVLHTELVNILSDEPNYDAALNALD